jgi:hypothetical protein
MSEMPLCSRGVIYLVACAASMSAELRKCADRKGGESDLPRLRSMAESFKGRGLQTFASSIEIHNPRAARPLGHFLSGEGLL